MQKVTLLGVKIDALSMHDLFAFIEKAVADGKRTLIFHVNIRALNLACEHDWYRKCINQADIAYCDGMGVQLAARFLCKTHVPRYTLPDWIAPFADVAVRQGYSLFFLGGMPGVAEKAAHKLMEQHPGLRIVGTHHGYFQKGISHPENQAVLTEVNAAKPDILIVGFGMPLQESWLQENWHGLEVKVAITGGAVFEYLSGNLKRGPKWMTDHYLEWLAKLVTSPERYASRYLYDIPKFAWRILREKLQSESIDTTLPRAG